ncbi:hypothetical protein, partial [Bradyrhizobium sp. BRP56]|uniref:hypothetical protein n=1 Tax=Bradyrhizobium sp. BRP56 TaxID=2793819 RepID=UPI001CD271CD
ARKQNPKTQETAAQHPAFLQNRTLHRDNFCLSIGPICILHGRLVSAERFDFRQPHFSLMLLDVPFIKKHLDQVNQHLNLAGLDVDD